MELGPAVKPQTPVYGSVRFLYCKYSHFLSFVDVTALYSEPVVLWVPEPPSSL